MVKWFLKQFQIDAIFTPTYVFIFIYEYFYISTYIRKYVTFRCQLGKLPSARAYVLWLLLANKMVQANDNRVSIKCTTASKNLELCPRKPHIIKCNILCNLKYISIASYWHRDIMVFRIESIGTRDLLGVMNSSYKGSYLPALFLLSSGW